MDRIRLRCVHCDSAETATDVGCSKAGIACARMDGAGERKRKRGRKSAAGRKAKSATERKARYDGICARTPAARSFVRSLDIARSAVCSLAIVLLLAWYCTAEPDDGRGARRPNVPLTHSGECVRARGWTAEAAMHPALSVFRSDRTRREGVRRKHRRALVGELEEAQPPPPPPPPPPRQGEKRKKRKEKSSNLGTKVAKQADAASKQAAIFLLSLFFLFFFLRSHTFAFRRDRPAQRRNPERGGEGKHVLLLHPTPRADGDGAKKISVRPFPLAAEHSS